MCVLSFFDKRKKKRAKNFYNKEKKQKEMPFILNYSNGILKREAI
jgi:hypothetical protein